MPKQRVYPKLITGAPAEVQRALNQLFEYILALETQLADAIRPATRVGFVTTPHVPYASSDGVLSDTSIHWDDALKLVTVQSTALQGGIYAAGFGAGVFGVQKVLAARGTVAVPTTTLSGDTLGFFCFQGYDPVVGFGGSASGVIRANATETFTAIAHGTQILIQVVPNGSVTRATAIIIEQSGTATTKSVIPVADSTHSLGSTGLRWLKLWVDDIAVTTDVEVGGDVHAVGQVRTDTHFDFNGTPGITGGRIVKDAAGVNQTVTIEGGIITGWTV